MLPRGSKNPRGPVIPGKSCIAMEREARDARLDNGAKPKADAMIAIVMMARNDMIFAD